MSHGRHAQILERLRTTDRVEVRELADALATSEVTIRRDLDELASAGVLRRVRGGAVSTLMRSDELPFGVREGEAADAKQRIGAAATELLRDGESVIVDSGTTGVAAARALVARRLTVMPMSLHAVGILSGSASITLLLAGGEVRPGEMSVVGPLAERGIAAFRFDTALLTCCGFSTESGATAPDIRDASVKRAAIESSARTIALVDGTKFTRTTLHVICEATDVDIVVTDTTAPGAEVERLRAAGVEVHCV
ncbi:DeoR/GlpR family DNA-binding transcription regulator [Solicola gregarius]|uniref:Lactose phosphotransferase system repressor n=1 Tax=Solicola gregarius TaxID=2908642 RepID=A0AA46TJH1_9ACTN|nr:DeoR/GlpR family DNA-binding transcription regulator [Solicola gregarius]UYM06472.1 DeoR/GlpR family DNA-binding transcription regulator [Solicola gregarius]